VVEVVIAGRASGGPEHSEEANQGKQRQAAQPATATG
jgi:hypothetical protein